MQNFQTFVNGQIEQMAQKMIPAGVIDNRGLDQDDYRSILHAKFWEVEFSLRERVDTESDLRAMTRVMLQRQTGQLLRARKRSIPTVSNIDADFGIHPVCMEDSIISRDVLRRIQYLVAPDEWALLIVYAEHKCSARGAWVALGEPKTRSGFYRKVRRLRCTVQKIIKNMG